MSTTNILDLCNRVDVLEKKHDSGGTAEDTTYDNTDSGLTADTVQGAIDELAGDIDGLSADDIDYDNTDSGLTADTVQGAIDELAESYPADKVMMSDGVTSVEDALDELTNNSISNSINISDYNAINNYYTAPHDGFVRFKGTSSDIAFVALVRDNATSVNISSSNGLSTGVFVKKGTKLFVYATSVGTTPAEAYFIGYTS